MLDTSTQQSPIIALWVIMTTLAAVTVCMRFYTRRLILHILGPEDWLIAVAMVFALGTCVGFIRQTMFGLGRHVWTLTPEMMKQWGIEQFYSFTFYSVSLAIAKISILFLYMRVMVHGAQRIAIYVVLGIVMVCNIWVFISNFIQCTPLQALWDHEVKGTCMGIAVTLGNSIMHIITDFIVFTLPIPTLAKLKIHRKQKIGLMVVFSIGFFVCLISIIRMVSISRLDFTDVPYQFSVVAYWGAVEVNLAIICACLTTLKPLVARFFPKLLDSMSSEKTSQGGTLCHTGRHGTIGGGGAGSAAQRTRRTTLEERSFARLDDDSLKSDEEEGQSPYEMEATPGKGGVLTAPGKTYAGVHVSHRERAM
ncbi:hypothetical protein C8A05DRAFT_20412 [Staphylotrichum tortipilum]|uniref:Rhodopsin domain-containing protein n=1 Tax=Staphylotrichum tortipilum TaxID=2831512 RepID=A0AAN6RNS6_9PEZI|nr:hypothetical protein C8A05DRAFT_20412 [Staphylotrichum longicolle]